MSIQINVKQPKYEIASKRDKLDVKFRGEVKHTQIQFTWADVPETRNSPGIPGQMSMDDDNVYICYAPDKWGKMLIMKGW
ncbi:hypothetical protein MASR1M45_12660 [Candidatus Kapaibacterium sp.]